MEKDVRSDLDIFSSDGLKKRESDRQFLLYHESIESAAREASLEAEKKELAEIFELGVNSSPGVSPSFLSRFFRFPLSSSIQSEEDEEEEEEEFTEIDEKEITSVSNDHYQSRDEEKKTKKESLLAHSMLGGLRSFLRELSEEMEVIRGMTEEEIFFQRRRERGKNSSIATKLERESMDFF